MAEINGILNIDNKNNYNINAVKKGAENSAGFSSYLGESKTLDAIFKQASKKYNVSEDLLKAIGKAESNFKTTAVSRSGAQGVMQLMPATAKSLGVTDSFDAEQNIMGGSKYIADLLKKYDGDTRLALAAYNAGSGNVAKYGGIPPFKETQNYVKKVMKYIGEGDIEIASANNNITGNSNPTNSKVAAASVTPVQRNLSFVISKDTVNIENELQDLKSLFSYEDYLRFIDLFLNDKKEKEKESKDNNSSYSSKDINYNVPVMNLLKDQKLI